jgi:hypothetical protein
MTHDPSHHAAGHAKPNYDDINTSLIVMVGIVSAIVTYISVVLIQALTYQMDMNMIRQRSHDVQYVRSIEAIDAQKDQLQAKPEIQRIGIDQAMAETVAQYAAGQNSGTSE